jgi:hypothetical protein
MANVHSKAIRDYNMSRIKGKHTKQEIVYFFTHLIQSDLNATSKTFSIITFV